MVDMYEGENIDHLLKRFRLECDRNGVVKSYRRHEYYVKPSLVRHRKICELKRKLKLVRIRKGQGDKHKPTPRKKNEWRKNHEV